MRRRSRLFIEIYRCLTVAAVIALLSCTRQPDYLLFFSPAAQTAVALDTGIVIKGVDMVQSYLALGDSYTIGQSVPVTERYPAQVVSRLRSAGFILLKDAEIIATSGWTTGNLLDAIKDKGDSSSYDLVTLLIGVNNQYQGGSLTEYRAQFTALLKKSIHFAGNRPGRVIVLSIPDYSVTPFATSSDKEKIAREIDAFNQANKKIADAYKVNYLNVTEESRKARHDPSLIAYDGLHFSGKEYSVWTSLMVPAIMEMVR